MSFAGEIEEVKKLWKNASWPMRGVIALSIFLTISSITSLSDVILKWKGFIIQGIEFYRAWVTVPLGNLASFFGLKHFSQLELDVIVVCVLSYSAYLRIWYTKKIAWACFFVFALIIYCVGSGVNSSDTSLGDLIFLGFYSIYFIISGVFTYKYDRANFLRAFGPAIIALVFILLLAAVNAGISKPI